MYTAAPVAVYVMYVCSLPPALIWLVLCCLQSLTGLMLTGAISPVAWRCFGYNCRICGQHCLWCSIHRGPLSVMYPHAECAPSGATLRLCTFQVMLWNPRRKKQSPASETLRNVIHPGIQLQRHMKVALQSAEFLTKGAAPDD